MGESWHNFFYAAYDPAGTLLIDKPPLALWIQVASTKLFGFSGPSIIAPVAIAGTLAVPLVFAAGRRSHGVAAGLLAALVLAVYPESVATARDSTMDAVMMMGLAAAGWLLVVAVEGKRPWLIVAWAALMGIVFNVKFFEGFIVLPAALLYIGWRFRDDWRPLVAPLAAAAAVGLVVSFAWVAAVELTPEDSRPLVMNDKSNSELGLVFRYNGLERVLPGEVTVFAPFPGQTGPSNVSNAFGVGDRGPLRLIQGSNGGLIGFGACLALGGVLVVLARRRDWLFEGPGLFWAAWLVTGVAFFSASNRAAAHYMESFAPALAVVAGVGLVEAWRARRRIASLRRDWDALIGPAVLLLLLAYGVRAHLDLDPIRTSAFVAIGIGILATLAVVLGLRLPIPERLQRQLFAIAIAAPIAVMLATSLWIALEAPPSGQITRPNPLIFAQGEPPPDVSPRVPAAAVLAHAEGVLDGARYRFAVTSINDAGEAIAYTGASILPIWNSYQRVPVLAPEVLQQLVRDGEVPYVLVNRPLASTGLLFELLLVMESECTPTRIDGVARTWQVWDCTPEANVSS